MAGPKRACAAAIALCGLAFAQQAAATQGAFRWLLEGFVVADLADNLDEEKSIVPVDSSIGSQTLRLEVSDAPGFAVGLARRWNGPY